jgi:hypothetical protein
MAITEIWRIDTVTAFDTEPPIERVTSADVPVRELVVQESEVVDRRCTDPQRPVRPTEMEKENPVTVMRSSSPKLEAEMVRTCPPRGSRSALGSTETIDGAT